jgi:hypothetical protein
MHAVSWSAVLLGWLTFFIITSAASLFLTSPLLGYVALIAALMVAYRFAPHHKWLNAILALISVYVINVLLALAFSTLLVP